jgi:anti-sigma B factor antagonist
MQGGIAMTINKTKNASELTVALEGRLDTTTAPELEAELKGSLEGITDLTLDLEKLEYISSAGLRVLLSAQKTMNKQGEMKLIHVCEAVLEIFEVTGFSDILTVE